MPLDPKTILALDKARIHGQDATSLHKALELSGHDPDAAFLEYCRTPMADGRLRGQVNLGDPAEWTDGQ